MCEPGVRASSRETEMALKLQGDYNDQVDMCGHGWHIDHEEDAQGSDDPTNKISVIITTIYERLP